MNWIWPGIQNLDDAKGAAGNGVGVAFFVALVTGIVTYLQTSGRMNLFPQIGPSAYIDAGLFLVIGVGILRMSRIAALAGLLLYIAEQYFMIKSGGRFGVAMIFFTLAFISSVRGTFAYHDMSKEEVAGQDAVESPPKKNPVKILVAGFLSLILIVGIAVVLAPRFLNQKVTWPRSSQVKFPPLNFARHKPGSQSVNGFEERQDKNVKTFHLKSGAVVRGRVVYEDETYYAVDIGGGKQEVVIKEDLAA